MVSEEPYFEAKIQEYPLHSLRPRKSILCDALMRTVKELFNEYCYLIPKMPKEIVVSALGTDDPIFLGEYLTGNLNLEVEDKQAILEESSYVKRLELLASVLENENSILNVEHDIFEKVKDQVDQNQREYYLREQLKAINEELGEGRMSRRKRMSTATRSAPCTSDDEVHKKLLEEADRLANSRSAAMNPT